MKKFYLIVSLALIVFTGCKKDDTNDGPKPNSNITNIDVEVKYSDWEQFVFEYSYGYEAIIDVPEITEEVLQSGAIITYLKDENDFYMVLPLTVHQGNYSVTYAVGYSVGAFDPAIIYNSLDIGTQPATMEFKIVILKDVPPVKLNMNNYEEVNEYYNLSNR